MFMNHKKTDHILSCKIIHQLPGRVRISCRALKYLNAIKSDLIGRLESLENIHSVEICHITHNALIYFDHTNTNKNEIITAVESAVSAYSFTAFKGEREALSHSTEERNLSHESIKPMIYTIAAAGIGIIISSFKRSRTLPITGTRALTSPLSLLTLGLSLSIFRSGLKAIVKNKRPNADTLSSAAILASVLSGKALSALTVIFLHEIAELLTVYTMTRTRNAISDMLSQGEEHVWRQLNDGELEKVAIEKIQIGDLIVVHTGEKISVDGSVFKGAATVDESSINGEFMPSLKNKNSNVFAGTIVKDGTITIKSEKVGDNTAVARIIKMVEEAADYKAPIQNFADKFSSQLLFLNLFLAGTVYAVTRNTARALNMLIIDYSCALRLSTVAAFSAAINTAARNGVLIKGSNYLEALSEADTLVLDKTGTVTSGKPTVESIIALNNEINSKEIIALAAAAEETSTHPLGTAIVTKAFEMGASIPKHTDIITHIGRGVETKVNRSMIRVGNKRFMNSFKIHTHPLRDKAKSLAMEGQSIVYVSKGKKIIGVIGINDPLRENMKKAINRLRYSGIDDIIMLTGDLEQQAEVVASRMHVDRYESEQMPEDKAKAILELQSNGNRVVMVGDGINDAAALAYSDIGIALGGSRTDVAMEAADITIAGDNPLMLASTYQLSNKTMDIIKQNFTTAITVNSLGLLLGGMGFLPVLGGAILHNASTIMVVANSLRLLAHDMEKKR